MDTLLSTITIHPATGTKVRLPLMMACRLGVLGVLTALALMSQTRFALACHDEFTDLAKALNPAGWALCAAIIHTDSSGTGPPQEQVPPQLKGFETTLPPDAPTGIRKGETRCFARLACPTGYRTFCVDPVGASPACCHTWRKCQKKF